jgi:cytochrome c oxidase subunit IV
MAPLQDVYVYMIVLSTCMYLIYQSLPQRYLRNSEIVVMGYGENRLLSISTEAFDPMLSPE